MNKNFQRKILNIFSACFGCSVLFAGYQLKSSGLQIRVRLDTYFSCFSPEAYVVGTRKNRLIETVLLSTHSIRFG